MAARIVPTTGKAYRIQRLRAFQLYATGLRSPDIARQLGVSDQAVYTWRKKDSWDAKLEKLTTDAVQAADFATGNVHAEALVKLDSLIPTRLDQLKDLCDDPETPPGTKLGALREWFSLADKYRQQIAESEAVKPVASNIGITGLHVVRPLTPPEARDEPGGLA